jgi:hypothetical protein
MPNIFRRKVSTSDDINIVGIALAFAASILSIAFAIATWRLAVATWRLHRQSQQQQRGDLKDPYLTLCSIDVHRTNWRAYTDLEANEFVFSLVVERKRR